MAALEQCSDELRAAIKRLVLEGNSPPEIKKKLQHCGAFVSLPTLRTIQRAARSFTLVDVSDPWTICDPSFTPQDCGMILEVANEIAMRSDHRVWPSIALASIIARIKGAVPSMPPWEAYEYAHDLLAADSDPLKIIAITKTLAANWRVPPPTLT